VIQTRDAAGRIGESARREYHEKEREDGAERGAHEKPRYGG
jgi:hypothetical protein